MSDVLIAHADSVRDVAVPGATSGLQGEGLEGTTLRHQNHGRKVRLGLNRTHVNSFLCSFIPRGSHSDWKTWKMGRHFPAREKSEEFEQTGKVMENHTKYWKTGNYRPMLFVIFSDI